MFSWFKNRNHLLGLITAFVVIFDLSLLVLWRTPGGPNNACMIGGNFTTGNILFSMVMSLLLAINVVGLVEVVRMKQKKDSAKIASLGSVGLLLWIGSTMCLACYLPLITIFGASFSLSFFYSYSGLLKVISLVVGVVAVWMVNRQIVDGCFGLEECNL